MSEKFNKKMYLESNPTIIEVPSVILGDDNKPICYFKIKRVNTATIMESDLPLEAKKIKSNPHFVNRALETGDDASMRVCLKGIKALICAYSISPKIIDGEAINEDEISYTDMSDEEIFNLFTNMNKLNTKANIISTKIEDINKEGESINIMSDNEKKEFRSKA